MSSRGLSNLNRNSTSKETLKRTEKIYWIHWREFEHKGSHAYEEMSLIEYQHFSRAISPYK